jgi:hypothetical protein
LEAKGLARADTSAFVDRTASVKGFARSESV